eukprot:m.160401 g.160401  ORF g.160401 m.160401 type:complete len:339 (+) comp24824_c0_seq3:155-1171(+)
MLRFIGFIILTTTAAAEFLPPPHLVELGREITQAYHDTYNCDRNITLNLEGHFEFSETCAESHGCDGDTGPGRMHDFWEAYTNLHFVPNNSISYFLETYTALKLTYVGEQAEAYGNNLIFDLTWESILLASQPRNNLPLLQSDQIAFQNVILSMFPSASLCPSLLLDPCSGCLPSVMVNCRDSLDGTHSRINIIIAFGSHSVDVHSSLGDLTALEYLEFGPIASLPDSVGQLQKLKALVTVGLSTLVLPPTMSSMGSLQRFSLSSFTGTRFSSLSVLCSWSNLRFLELNGVSGYPLECIGDLHNLVRFIFLSNQLDSPTALPSAWGYVMDVCLCFDVF